MPKLRGTLLPVILMIALIIIPLVRFYPLSYREDEAWSVHAGLYETVGEVVRQASGDVNPPGFHMILYYWTRLVGHHEIPVRYLSLLTSLLTFALVYRLTCDMFDKQTGIWAIFILGTLPTYLFYAHEARTSSIMYLAAAGTALMLLRWLQNPRGIYAFLYVLFGILGVYNQFTVIYVILAQAIFTLIVVRDWRRLLRSFTLFGMVGMAFVLGWGIAIINVVLGPFAGGIIYSLPNRWWVVGQLNEQLQLSPIGVGYLLLAFGVIAAPLSKSNPAVFRLGRWWQRSYLLLLALGTVVTLFGVNAIVRNATTKNVAVIIVPLAVLAAYGARKLPVRAQIVLAIVLLIPALTRFRIYSGGHFYRETIAYIEANRLPDAGYIIDDRSIVPHVPVIYYLTERTTPPIPENALFHLVDTTFARGGLERIPHIPSQILEDATPPSQQIFEDFIGTREQIWHLHLDSPSDFSYELMTYVQDNYVLYQSQTWDTGRLDALDYRRIPDDLRVINRFDDTLTLQSWRLRGDVQLAPCQSVTVESWWQTDQPLPENYSLSLTAINANGERVAAADAGLSPVLTQQWQPEQLYLDSRSVQIPCDTVSGDYPLGLSVYDPNTVESLRVTTADGNETGAFIYLTTLFVN